MKPRDSRETTFNARFRHPLIAAHSMDELHFSAIRQRLEGLRLRVAEHHWTIRSASLTSRGELEIKFDGSSRGSVTLALPQWFDGTHPEHMVWLLGHLEFRLSTTWRK